MKNVQKNIIKASIVLMILFIIIVIAFLINLGLTSTLINSPYNKRLNELRDSTEVGSIYDKNNILIAGTSDGQREYHSDVTMRNAHSHLIGDTYGYCPTGCDINLASILLDTKSSVFSTINQIIKDENPKGDDIQLTVDYRLNVFAYELMENYSGAVVIQDYTTGEILCMVSTPAFDPSTLIDNIDYYNENDAFVNRAIQGQYAPGSMFHIITAGAALEYINDIDNKIFACNSIYAIDNEVIFCDTGHGNINLQKAFASSCDTIFAGLGVELGANNIVRFSEQLLFNKDFSYSYIVLYPSSITVSSKEEDAAYAYTAIGQHETLISPLHLNMIIGAIANDGTMMTPNLLQAINNSDVFKSHGTRIITDDTAQTLQKYMASCVSFGSANLAYSDVFTLCGKDGTAISSTDDSLYPNAWFAGYIQDNAHPLAICVITEQSFIDENVSAVIAKKLLEYAYTIGY